MKNVFYMLLMSMTLIFSGCSSSDDVSDSIDYVKSITNLNINIPSNSIANGLSMQMHAAADYSDGTSVDVTNDVVWNSNTPSIATVTDTGLFQALSEGQAFITIEYGGFSSSNSIDVLAATLTSVKIDSASNVIPNGSTLQATATGSFTDGVDRDISNSMTWQSSNTTIATVSSTGVISALNEGNVNISVEDQAGLIEDTKTFSVVAPLLDTVEIQQSEASILIGDNSNFTATAIFEDGSTLDVTDSTTWSSPNAEIATIDDSGVATGIAEGTVNISGIYNGIEKTLALEVYPPHLELYAKNLFSSSYVRVNLPSICNGVSCQKRSQVMTTASTIIHGEYKLVAVGQNYTIDNLIATDLYGAINTVSFSGLTAKTINSGEEILFKTQSGRTGNQDTKLRWSFNIDGTTAFMDTIYFKSN